MLVVSIVLLGVALPVGACLVYWLLTEPRSLEGY